MPFSEPKQWPWHISGLAAAAYVGSAILTTIPPLKAASFITISALISTYTAPLFAKWLHSYRQVALVPTLGQLAQLATAGWAAKKICHLFHLFLTTMQIVQITAATATCLFASRLTFIRIQNHRPLDCV